jgi:GntR family transcriptional regulator
MHSAIILGRSDGRPIYIQIIEQIRHRIALGDWPAGHQLPSIRELAAELRVSVITVKRAYLELEREGVILTRQGVGSTVADAPALGDRLLEDELANQIARLAHTAARLGLGANHLA